VGSALYDLALLDYEDLVGSAEELAEVSVDLK
jgi:hypothetical protein